MKYISRRISVTNQHGEEIEYTDTDFFCINAPLIILGEPGAGKSELLRFASEQLGAQTYNASTIEAGPAFDEQTPVIIVDGIDEITAYETGTPVNKILAKLPKTVLFVLSCRAADWQDTVNTRIINQKWQQQPIVGRVIPLNQQEIIDFVNANGEGQNGEKFLKEAQQRDVVDLLRNPQNLLLVLKAVNPRNASVDIFAASQWRFGSLALSQKNFFLARIPSIDFIKQCGKRLVNVQTISFVALSSNSKSTGLFLRISFPCLAASPVLKLP